jgi:hypothetical protein
MTKSCLLYADSPVPIITHEGSTHQTLLVVEHGDPAPELSCSADGFPDKTSISWESSSRGTSVITGGQSISLVWKRSLEYLDSGNYTCMAVNSRGTGYATLQLLVRREYLCRMY